MSKFETVCPYCKKTNAVEKSSFVDEHGLQKIQCSHCSKGWATDLSVTGSLAYPGSRPIERVDEEDQWPPRKSCGGPVNQV